MNETFTTPLMLVFAMNLLVVVALYFIVRSSMRSETRRLRVRLDAYSNLLTEILIMQGYTREQIDELKNRPRR